MLETLLQTALKQAPSLVVTLGAFLYVVRAFLRHIEESTDRQEKRDAARDAVEFARAENLHKLGDACHAVQREATDVMAAVRVTLEANTRVLEENNRCLCEVARGRQAAQGKLHEL